MSFRTTIVLLVLLVAGSGYVVFTRIGWLKGKPPATQTAEKEDRNPFKPIPSKPLLPDLAQGKIEQITLAPRDGAKVRLSKQGEDWRILEPINVPAAAGAVSDLTYALSRLEYVKRYSPTDADYPREDLTGLSAPALTVSVVDAQKKTYSLKVGSPVPLSSSVYVQVEGSPDVYVIEKYQADGLAKTAGELRKMQVVQFKPEEAVRLAVRGGERYQLVRINKEWSIDSPISARADQLEVDKLLQNISSIAASKFLDDPGKDLAGYGLAAPRLEITVELAGETPASGPAASAPSASAPAKGRTIHLAFGAAPGDKVFAMLEEPGWVFQMDAAKLKGLQPKMADLRDKRVMDIGGKEIAKLEIQLAAGGSSVLEKDQDKWLMRSPIAGQADGDSVRELVSTLGDLKVTEFEDKPADPATYGLEPPVGKIVMHFRGNDQTGTLLLGKASDSGQTGFAQLSGSKSVAVLPSATYAKLLHPAAGYWERTILKLPDLATILRITVAQPEKPEVTIARTIGNFQVVSPIQADADVDAGNALADAVRTIRADKVVALGDVLPERFAKLKPARLSVEYKLAVVAPTQPASAPSTASAPATTSSPATATATQTASGPSSRPGYGTAGPLLVAKDQDKSYVWIEGAKPVVVGELPADFHDKVSAELRSRSILKLQPDKAVSLKLVMPDATLELAKSVDAWRYTTDQYVKIEPDKIKRFLTDLGEIKAQRFVEYLDKPDLAARYRLDQPAMTIEVTDDAGKVARLLISKAGPVGTEARYASTSDVSGVFVLAPEAPKKVQKSLEDLRKDDKDKEKDKPPADLPERAPGFPGARPIP